MGKNITTDRNQNNLLDQFSRTISYLRLSLTDRCNLNCLYCRPGNNDEHSHLKASEIVSASELLSYEELLRVVTLTVSLGMTKIRLTGGEPLLRKGIFGFIENLTRISGLEEIRLTTNGVLLEDKAKVLWDMGIRHLNISLDSLQRSKFHRITGKDYFDRVWKGIQVAKDLGFKIKLNVVAIRGINDDEFVDFGKFALREPIPIRFIEFMPLGEHESWKKHKFIAADEIKDMLSTLGELKNLERNKQQGPARMFLLKNSLGEVGRIGFISPISHHFCEKCNRLRLTSEGKLRSCLLHDRETDIKRILRQGCTDQELEDAIRQAVLNKPQGHSLKNAPRGDSQNYCKGNMSRIGG